jgi:hypothetical protein
MTARFAGTCRTCGGKIHPGDAIRFRGKGNSVHASCEPGTDPSDGKAEIPQPGNVSPSDFAPVGNVLSEKRWSVDWPELRDELQLAFSGDFGKFKNAPAVAQNIAAVANETFTGYSRTQAIDWLENGYSDEELRGLEDFAPPIREKRRFVYGEEGDEIDLSAAWAGEDNFMTHWTKRDVIPGIALEFPFCFAANVPANVVNEYQHWIAQATEAIQSAGIDPEISIVFMGNSTWDDVYREEIVRVKKQNETVDVLSWSAMLSPAVYRTFGFLTKCLSAEARNRTISSSIGRGHRGTEWKVRYDAETGTIRTDIPWTPRMFDADSMTTQLRIAIEELKKS